MRNMLKAAILSLSFLALFSACGAKGDGDGPLNPPSLLTGQWT